MIYIFYGVDVDDIDVQIIWKVIFCFIHWNQSHNTTSIDCPSTEYSAVLFHI